MVELYFRGHPTDFLFQYCFARSLAEHWGYHLRCAPIPFFPGTYAEVGGEIHLSPQRVWQGDWPHDEARRRHLSIEECWTAPSCRLKLEGAFRQPQLFIHRAKSIREDWLALPNASPLKLSGALAVCADPGNTGFSPEEITTLLERTNPSQIVFFSRDPLHPSFAIWRELGAELVTVDGWSSLGEIGGFQRIAIAQNHFYWWGAFLSHAREIYLPGGPVNQAGYSMFEANEISAIGDPRFTRVCCA
jgi:hypothetical protein